MAQDKKIARIALAAMPDVPGVAYKVFSLLAKEKINVGRGSIVNERDLCCALREGLIAGAALDVLSSEPIRSDSPLLKMADDDRLYITPHIAWASKEARTRLIGLVQKNIASYLEGGMENRVV